MESQYIAIPVKGITMDSCPDFDLYLKVGEKVALFRKAGCPFGKETLLDLVALGESELYIKKEDCAHYESYRREVLTGQPGNKGMLEFEGRFADPDEVDRFYNVMDNFFPVDRKVFNDGLQAAFPLFLRQQNEIHLLPDSEEPLDNLSYLSGELMIRNEDISLYRNLLDSLLAVLDDSGGLREHRVQKKAALLKEFGKASIQLFLENPVRKEHMSALQFIANEIVGFSLGNYEDNSSLLAEDAKDFYTATHSYNVAVYAVSLGIFKGLHRKPDLEWLALGGLLHDIGKCRLDARIVNKPGKLTLPEFLKVKYHVRLGLDLLKENHHLPDKVLEMVAQHHERLAGHGYPLGLRDEQIRLFGRIAAIADSFDVLTTDRVYKKALSPEETLEVMSKARGDFDPTLLSAFTHILGHHSICN